MGEGREVAPGGRVRAHEMLVERIVSAPVDAHHEKRARVIVDAVAELLERDIAQAPHALESLLEDDRALERLAAWLDRPASQVSRLLGGAAVALLGEPTNPERRKQIARALHLIDPGP